MNIKKYTLTLTAAALVSVVLGCRKETAFLDAKTDQQLFVPSTLTDLANMMHDENALNKIDPALGQIACDDYYVTPNVLNAASFLQERNGYIWAKQVYSAGQNVNDWNQPYTAIYYCNTVLDYLGKVNVGKGQEALANEVKGDALFFRGKNFYSLLETFSLPYHAATAANTPGLPIRLSADLNIKSVRSSSQACYAQVVQDLQQAAILLPDQSAYRTEPSKPAALGMLARVYLSMGDYQQAYHAADQALQLYSTLTDYNTLVPASRAISTSYLSEDIFHCVLSSYSLTSINSTAITDTLLYRSFASNDLRKSLCFVIKNNNPYFRGTYDFKRQPYSGIATDELYLDRAECQVRLGNVQQGMNDLNTLLAARWKKGTFVNYTASSATEALTQILNERRKELLFRGIRWNDLRRLNQDAVTATTLVRNLNGTVYQLPPNDVRYAWPIPDNEISNSGIPQNPR